MVALVSVETVLLVLLVVLVAALLRSHAEILRRLGPEDASERAGVPEPPRAPGVPEPPRAPGVPEPPPGERTPATAPELAGATPTGDAIKLAFDGTPTLLAFLSSGCTSCGRFWETLGERRLPAGLETVIVTRGRDRENVPKLRKLAPAAVPVLMSSEAWTDYDVPGTPYFVLVEDGAIRGEGVATTWDALASLVGDAIDELGIDERLAAAGIGPEHPSLFPGGRH
jgi:hypothetical protein